MKRIEMTVDFKSDVEKVFSTVSNIGDCSWRSDLSRVEKITDDKYVECNRKNRLTKIKITNSRKSSQFEFDVQNEKYFGHWCGQFAPLKDGGCRMYIIYDFEPVSIFGKLVNLEKFVERYIEDLKKELQEY